MGHDLETGKLRARFRNLRGRELVVNHTRAIGRDDLFVDAARLHFCTHVFRHQPVGHKENAAGGKFLDDSVDVARGHTHVALGLHVGRAVDVTDHGGVGVERFEFSHAVAVNGIGQGATRAAIRHDDGGFGRKDFRGFGHEHDSDKHDDLRLRLFRHEAEVIGVTLEVAHTVNDLRLDVRVRQDDGVFFFFQPVDFEGERRDLAARFEIPRPPARVALDMHERAEEAIGLDFDFR